jgi:ElaA protein
MNWQFKKFNELTLTELYDVLKLRSQVFVVEQNCVFLDMDDKDVESYHLYYYDKEGILASYCRIAPPNLIYEEPSIGRVITGQNHRKLGLGKKMISEAILRIEKLYPFRGIKIGAQLYLKQFYESFGFTQMGDIYLEDGIEHIKMKIFT